MKIQKRTQTVPVAIPGHHLKLRSFDARCVFGANPHRTSTGGRSILVSSLFAAVLLTGLPHLRADEFQQLKLVVNQLDHATVPDLAQRQKEMNDILKQCDKHGKTRMRVTIVQGRQNANPMDGGNPIAPDGKVPSDDASGKLDKEGLAHEIKDGGSKFWVAKEVKDNHSDVINGSTAIGTPSTVVTEQSGHNGDARTWTHELGHQLGLDHDEDHLDNLMYPARLGPKPEGGGDAPLAGTGITMDQCQTMVAKFNTLHPTKAHTKEQQNQPRSHEAVRTIVHPPSTGVPILDWTRIFIDAPGVIPTNPALHLTFFLNLLLETNLAPADFQLLLDLDNNPGTGDTGGFDAKVELFFEGTNGQAIFQPLPIGDPIALPDPLAGIVSRLDSGETNFSASPMQTAVSSDVPLEILSLSVPQIRVLLISQIGTAQDFLGPDMISVAPDPEPELQVTPSEGLPGINIVLQASGFAPDAGFYVLCGDQPIANGMTLPNGDVSAAFSVPALEPNDYLVDVIDEAGQVQIAVLRVHDPIGLQVEQQDANTLAISFKTILNVTYIVEATPSLENPDWQTVQTIIGDGDPASLTASLDENMRFLRYRIQEP